jgi:Beta-propeller repeat
VTLPANTPARTSTKTQEQIRDVYGNRELAFVPNAGQADQTIRYYAQGAGFGFFFTSSDVILSFKRHSREQQLRLVPIGASAAATLEGRGPRRETINYFVGPTHHTNLAAYQEIVYRQLWPGIDMIFRGRGGKLEYEFLVAPGADPSLIRLEYTGAGGLSIGTKGDLLLDTGLGTLRDSRPRTYQLVDGERVLVRSRYLLDKHTRTFGFALGPYERDRPLLIDPGPDYSTYLGGASSDFGIEIAVDATGNAYVTGQTASPDFPSSAGALDTGHGGLADAFVAKLDTSGSGLVYTTYIGGSGAEAGLAITVDDAGQAYVSGGTASSDFPTTTGAFDTSHNGYEDVWVAKLNAEGSAILYSTLLGGSQIAGDFGAAIAVDDRGRAYVSGGSGSPDFPTTSGAFDASHNGEPNQLDAFIAKLNEEGSALVFSTRLGGKCNDAITAIALDDDDVYVTGSTVSADFPTTAKAHDRRYGDREDGFIAKLNAEGSDLAYSTFLGGNAFDKVQGVAIDEDAQAYVTGWTESANFPTTRGAVTTSHRGGEDGFVAKLDAQGSKLVYSTYVGGGANDRGHGIAVDAEGRAHVTGLTASPNLPTSRDAVAEQQKGAEDGFVAKLNTRGSKFLYATYLGGSQTDFARAIALDSRGNTYVTGRTRSPDFPATTFDTSANGELDVFVTKLGM